MTTISLLSDWFDSVLPVVAMIICHKGSSFVNVSPVMVQSAIFIRLQSNRADVARTPTAPHHLDNFVMAASIHIYSLWWLPVLFLAILPVPTTSASSVSHALQAETSFILHPKRHHGHQYTLHRRRRQATSGSGELEPAVIELLHISSNISARFGITEMNSVMINGNDEDLEVKFQVSTCHTYKGLSPWRALLGLLSRLT